MIYKVIRNISYDFAGESYKTKYPNLHKYPATMLPQIGINILKELNISSGKLLDPYCGSGSSFAAALEVGIKEMYGYDINPLAVLISQAKFTKLNPDLLDTEEQKLRKKISLFLNQELFLPEVPVPEIKNREYWFSEKVTSNLAVLKYFISQIESENIQRFFYIPFAETVRESSFTRKNEFKLYRMKPEQIERFNPDVFTIFLEKLHKTSVIYKYIYYPKLKEDVK